MLRLFFDHHKNYFLQAEKVFNQDLYFKKTVKYVGEPMTHLESIASSAVCLCYDLLQVRAAIKVKASIIICFTSSGRAARWKSFKFSHNLCCSVANTESLTYMRCLLFLCRLIAKYRPTMPVLSVVIPRLKTNQLRWSFSGAFEVCEILSTLCTNIDQA
ncbi:hypothetical protein B296_00040835 [Ensete ventricosum]|uniref:Uncharacterized protein n=1 Tax=Ensete ventricosum TaxID=4639 RepID=A0A426YNV4_ENSVE|nr:hypothetical protein B296_00040835 [Ensete ventricosum]